MKFLFFLQSYSFFINVILLKASFEMDMMKNYTFLLIERLILKVVIKFM